MSETNRVMIIDDDRLLHEATKAVAVTEGFEVKSIEVDTSESVDAFHVKLKDGRVIKKTNRCFTYRKGEGPDGTPVRVDKSGKVYVVGKSGALYNQEPKLNKAEKKRLKKQRREVACGTH